ncbi:protein lethal(2)essential for life-like [Ischnura elegans]|uniref:protein lethal(2)essential for life-like n=1 Tax=Ischnura elegans TaxID=197161 RepID=UPI001ED87085|nr:protein lethal(2)essential for life-like [Ischnura elegans]
MSLVRSILADPWYECRTPSMLFDQDFGLGLALSDLVQPITDRTLAGYLRPWRLLAAQNSGTSSVRLDKDGFNAVIDVQQFAPEEIFVKTVGDQVVVEAKHEEKRDEHGFVSRHFVRRYDLPKGILPENVTSTLSSDGILTISAPKAQSAQEGVRVVPITATGVPAVKNVKEPPKNDPDTEEHKAEKPKSQTALVEFEKPKE